MTIRHAAGSGTSRRCTIQARAGYTLIELAAVVLIIAIVMSVALPQLLPLLAYSRLEGAARHTASYGRSAMAQSALDRETIIVRFDLDAEPNRYWAVRRVETEGGLFDDEEDDDEAEKDVLDVTEEYAAEILGAGREEELAQMNAEIEERFNRFFRLGVEARARNVEQDGFLADVGPDFKEFRLDDDEEDEYEEVEGFLLGRVVLPEDVIIESVRIGTTDHTSGLVEVEVTPLGLFESVAICLKEREDEDTYTVLWDPITGGAHVRREEPL
ncbi:MAG: type II secretion system protein [Candidatus Hydrogenedentes bacterium]|nr:type II secretion system protein [Candidatus Hydrogenedentota bacterium]